MESCVEIERDKDREERESRSGRMKEREGDRDETHSERHRGGREARGLVWGWGGSRGDGTQGQVTGKREKERLEI